MRLPPACRAVWKVWSIATFLVPAGMHGALAAAGGTGEAAPGAPGEDVSQISVGLDTLTVLEGKQGDIEVLQLLRVRNAGDRPYFGQPLEASPSETGGMPRLVMRVPLPEGAFDIAPSDLSNPQGMSESPAGIFTTAPLPPGETLISYIYRVRPARTGWALRREIDFPTRSVNLLLGPGLSMQAAPGFALIERTELGGVEYRRFRAGPFSPGSVLTADIGFGDEPANKLWPAFAVAATAAAALALGIAVLLRRRAGTRTAAERPAGTSDVPAGSREDLVLEIALLDEEFDSGSIPEAAYRSRRRDLKAKLENQSEKVKQ